MEKDSRTNNCDEECSVTINITANGNVNIYNCSKSPEEDCGGKGATDEDTSGECAAGACVPLGLGSKPKQSQQDKLERFLRNKTAPSSVAAAFLQAARRFAAGKAPQGEMETVMFNRLNSLSPNMKKLMKCTNKMYDSLPSKYKALFDGSILQDINTPVTQDILGSAFGNEISTTIANTVLMGVMEEVPGKIRLFDIPPGEEVFTSQVKIFKVNDFRTIDNIPALQVGDFLPEEFQQVCVPTIVNDHAEWNCSMQEPPCDGFQLDNVCMRVPQVQSGTSVTLEGSNYFNINAKVRFKIKNTSDNPGEVDAFVSGDITTPATETINGENRIINDSRVHDKIFFTIPADTPPGIYEISVVVPNTSSFPGLGQELVSGIQFIEVVPPLTARFQIATERLWARKETAPQSWGSDEVGIRIITVPILEDLTLLPEQVNSFRFDDVDSQETRTMDRVIFSQSQSVSGVVVSILGHEIDSEDAYTNMVTEWTDVFVDLLKEQIKFIIGSSIAMGIIKKLASAGFWGYVAIAIGVVVVLAIDLFVALWAPADLIIQDTLAFSTTDLVRLTNINVPAPTADSDKTLYKTPEEIKVRLMESSKIANQYKEERGYISDDEDSWYNIRLRYNRLA
jgi:hypothetical protein